MCQGSELGLPGMGAGTNLSHGPGQDRGGLHPRIRRVQIPLPAWCPPHACHVQGIRGPDPILGHTTASSSPSQPSQRENPQEGFRRESGKIPFPWSSSCGLGSTEAQGLMGAEFQPAGQVAHTHAHTQMSSVQPTDGSCLGHQLISMESRGLYLGLCWSRVLDR